MPDRPRASSVVANPGHMPWLAHAAAALDRAGDLRAYLAPFAGAHRRSQAPLPGVIRRELARRRPDTALDPLRVHSAASVGELTSVAARRLRAPGASRRALADRRDRLFARAVASHLSDRDEAALLGYGSALEAIETARRKAIFTAVEQAVHHHAFNRRILNEERKRVPEYAATLQFHQASPRRDRRLEAELRAADRVVALSQFSRETFIGEGLPPEKVLVNQLGADTESFAGSRRAEDGVFRVLFAGVLTQRKGLSYAVEGFRRAGIDGSELLLAGDVCNGSAPWHGSPGVRHRPWVARSEMPSLFASADVLVLPSLVEGLARVIIEAMAAGVPVVATPNSGAGDVVRDGVDGYIVPIRDSDAIAERLRALNEPGRRGRFSAAARERARDFTWNAYGERSRLILARGKLP